MGAAAMSQKTRNVHGWRIKWPSAVHIIQLTGRHRQGARRHLEADSGGVGVAHAALPDPAADDSAAQHYEGVRRALRDIERAITTHLATRWAKGVQKLREPAIYPPKPTVDWSVFACFAVRYNGAMPAGPSWRIACCASRSYRPGPRPAAGAS